MVDFIENPIEFQTRESISDADRSLFALAAETHKQGKLNEAMGLLSGYLRNNPESIEGWVNAGTIAYDMKRYEEALTLFERAASLNDSLPYAHYNAGHAYRALGKFVYAECAFSRAASRTGHVDPEIAYELACEWLRAGDWPKGFAFFAHRKHDRPVPNIPLWEDQPLDSKHLLVTSEQGIGEMVMFSQAVPFVNAGKVTFAVDKRLHRLFARSFPYVEICGDDIPAADYHIRVGDLFGKAFRTSWSAPRAAFLKPDLEAVEALKAKQDILKIGFAFKSTAGVHAAEKTLPHDAVMPLVHALGNMNLVMLQSDDALEGVTPLGIDDRGDLDDLCTQIASCDLVICGSNSVAHLAAGLGVPTWVLVPKAQGLLWHWGIGQDIPSTYGANVQIFRQAADGEWTAPVNEVMEKLTVDHGDPKYTGKETMEELVSKFGNTWTAGIFGN